MIIWLITGFLVLTGCAEAAHLITIFTDKSLQTYTRLCLVFVLAGFLVYIFLLFLGDRTGKLKIGTKEASGIQKGWNRGIIVFLICTGVTVYHFWSGYVPEFQDAVYELVLGNLKAERIMTLHPFLGTDTEAVMPLRMRILGLSSFYSALITISQQSAYTIMCKVVPLVIWGLSILLYWEFSKELFPGNMGKRWTFISMIAVMYLITSGGTGLVGNRLFYSGFSGETIRAALLMPYTVYVSWCKKWYLALLAVLAEACLVWTTFGIGYCFLIAVGMFLVHCFLNRRRKDAA